MIPVRQEGVYMAIVVQEGQLVAFPRPKRRDVRQAVRDLLCSLPDQKVYFLTFDLTKHRWAAAELAEWITEFKRLYHEMVIQKGHAAQLPSFAVFADRFTEEDKQQLSQVGAVLFDRSLPCNHDCQTTDQLMSWLIQNRQIALAADTQRAPDLPAPSAQGISPENLQALNSYPPGMTAEGVRHILKTLNMQ
jgi:hypothetical protein